MINIRKIHRDLKIAKTVLSQIETDLTNNKLSLKNAHNEKNSFNAIWKKMEKNGRYIDPYTNQDRTAEYKTELNIRDTNIKKLESKINQLENSKTLKEYEVRSLEIKYVSAKHTNIQERKAKLAQLGNKVKAAPKKVLETIVKGAKEAPGLIAKGFSYIYNDLKLEHRINKAKEDLKIRLSDKLFNKALVDHAIGIEVGKRKTLLNETPSKLKGAQLENANGTPSEKYDHYDQYTHSADIDVNDYYYDFDKYGKNIRHTVSNVTVMLDENNQINFADPRNKELLQHSNIVNQLIEKYPHSIESLPPQYIVNLNDKNKQALSQSYEHGIDQRITEGNFGYDENGNSLDVTQFLNNAHQRFNNKNAQCQALVQAKANNHYEFT